MEDSQLLRYSRQIMLPHIDLDGQQKLLNSRALIVGVGGLGSPAAMYLAAAGVGTLIINDFDQVDLTNLQRQIVHSTDALAALKVDSARQTLLKLNPEVRIETIGHRLNAHESQSLISSCDIVLDCTDNFATRFQLNRAAVATKTPLISAAVIRLEGQITTFDPRNTSNPCYACLYTESGDLEETCVRNGVAAPLPGILGSMQALEAIKVLLDFGKPLIGRLLLLDGYTMEWAEMRFAKNPNCPVCND